MPYDVAHWRKGENLPTEQGLVVGSVSESLLHKGQKEQIKLLA